MVALAFYVFLATFSHKVLWTSVGPLVHHLLRTFGRYGPFVCISAICSVTMFMLVLPQMALAVIGGLLCRRFRITITPH